MRGLGIPPFARTTDADNGPASSDAVARLQNGPEGPRLAEAMRTDELVQDAASYALKAQAEFYEAIWMWHLRQDPLAGEGAPVDREELPFAEWKKLPLNAKTLVISRMLASIGSFTPFYPQDAAARIDELIATGQAERLSPPEISSLLKTIVAAGAVREDDYYLSKNKLYKQETLPQLPFFH